MASAAERGESKLCSDLSKRRHFKVDNGELRLKQMSNLDSEDSDCLRPSKNYFGHARANKSQLESPHEPRQEPNSSTPIILGALPIVANFFFHGTNQWVEICIVIVIMTWVYYILQSMHHKPSLNHHSPLEFVLSKSSSQLHNL
jgi:hypothetical protein